MYSLLLGNLLVKFTIDWDQYNFQEIFVGKGHKSCQLDVTDVESVNSVLKQVFSDYSAPPTVVVNAAGITRDNFMLKMSVQDFESVFNVNVKVRAGVIYKNTFEHNYFPFLVIVNIALFHRKGTFLVTQTICKELVEKKLSGSIVNIGSIVAQRGNIGQCNYSASKAAVEVFSKTVALEMAR